MARPFVIAHSGMHTCPLATPETAPYSTESRMVTGAIIGVQRYD
jgi:hypothetical protein